MVHDHVDRVFGDFARVRKDTGQERIILKGELTSPIDPKPCCRFAARCPYATDKCFAEEPTLREMKPNHMVACHYAEKFVK